MAGLPADGPAAAAGAAQVLWDDFIADDLLSLVGGVAWVVAVVAAALAYRCVRDGHRNGAGAVDGQDLLVKQITRRTR